MVGLPEFSKWQKYYVEKAMWSDEQFEGRLNRKVRLAPSISDEDFLKIAQSHYPEGNEDAWNMLTGYALASGKKQARAIVAVLKSAHHEAKKAGREVIAFKDIKHAVKNIHLPSDHGYSGRDATVPPPAQEAGAAAELPAGNAPRPKRPRQPRKPRAGALQRPGSRNGQPGQDLFDRPAPEPDPATLAPGRGCVTQPSPQAA
jgi:hypothetical protein